LRVDEVREPIGGEFPAVLVADRSREFFRRLAGLGGREDPDPLAFYYNPNPPVEFFGRGVNVEVPWLGGRTLTVSGNSFATPHISSICALILSKHPDLTPFQLKSVLYLTATNVGGAT
ncbi:MAG TPA: S8 family serine peptidase, partial [Vicinamibacteria bacterium]|nr:S8 family serine peptidase [Vicinamibacteria bacterium]